MAIEVPDATAKSGIPCDEIVHAIPPRLIRWGGERMARCRDATGIARPPASGDADHELPSRRHRAVEPGTTFHIHSKMILDDGGLYIAESIVITKDGRTPFTTIPRALDNQR